MTVFDREDAFEREYVSQLSSKLSAVNSRAAAVALFGIKPATMKSKATDLDSMASTRVPEDGLSLLSTESGTDSFNFELPEIAPMMPVRSGSRKSRRPSGAVAGGVSNTSVASLLMKSKTAVVATDAPVTLQEQEEVKVASAPMRPPGNFAVAPVKKSWADQTLDDDEADAAPAAACSVGSTGHPELCSRPCMHVATAAGCAVGACCEYCHMDHPKRAAHLDKRHRELLREMSPADWGSMFIPIVRRKVVAIDQSGAGMAILEQICAAAQIPFDIAETSPARHQRMLVLTLRAMSLRALISAMHRSLPHIDEDLSASLTRHLRGLFA